MKLLEICIDSVDSAINAEKAGADRLELCENLIQGGVTPSLGKINSVVNAVSIPVHVLIRPRAGNFFYSNAELDIISDDINQICQTGIQGIVIGALDHHGNIQSEFIKKCKSLSNNKKLIFHRAFDLTRDFHVSSEILIDNGVDTILTSGQKNTAKSGVEVLAALQRHYGNRINILAGGGVRTENISFIHDKTGIKQFHSSAKLLIENNMSVSMSSSPVAEQLFAVDSDEVKSMKEIIHAL